MDICLNHVSKSYGELSVLRDLSLRFPERETTCLMGPSGCGKTTLLRLLMGLEKCDAGEITGVPERISAVFQEDRLCLPFSAAANIRLVTGRRVPVKEIRALLALLGLEEAGDKRVEDFSGGMRRRVAIARCLLAEGPLVLLDEPFKGLDGELRRDVAGIVRRYTAGRTVILVTHEEEDAAALGGQILRM